MPHKIKNTIAAVCIVAGGVIASPANSALLFSETFDGVTTGYDRFGIQNGIPTSGGGNGIGGGADQDWYGARFEYAHNGDPLLQDIATQNSGGTTGNGSSNLTPVGRFEDDAGLLFRIDTSGYQSISLSFDWRTNPLAGNLSRFVAGYFVGDFTTGHPDGGFSADRTIDLRNEIHTYWPNPVPTTSDGSRDGPWNWSVDGRGGNTGNWNETLRSQSHDWVFDTTLDLTLAADQPEVWVAFWMDDGDGNIGYLDNVQVTGQSVVPVPAAIWLFGSGLVGLFGLSKRGNGRGSAKNI